MYYVGEDVILTMTSYIATLTEMESYLFFF